ncbi:aspartate/tyrosine/aromatic aminotransferase [Hoeflea sp. WL0058]|uniref:Aminotransferase n=1 Tax=Flavimaribacter sediminis TaxID=2865987 RepID=A0AAE2ZR37_9HYPH|nr:amino acid aminotransferase [Flavimaribacter sediminis]MBW8639270.1 aspartate/tyrosine/aromatic aminotransferase [Flavimaribacter sediminis]
MFENVQAAPADKILGLMMQFREDPRDNKLDLGVGVYKDSHGDTPVLAAVKSAELRLFDSQKTKAYVGVQGDKEFCAEMASLVLGDSVSMDRARICQAPGGTGALSILSMLIGRTAPDATVWLSDPTWPNHMPLLKNARLKTQQYPYYDTKNGKLLFDGMMEALSAAKPGDVLLVHGCCHNPTGADLDLAQWAAIADLCLEKGLLPFVDFAYLGFGDGLEEDAAGLRLLASKVPEMLIAASCSKNFGVYRERVGAAMIIAAAPAQAEATFTQLMSVTRAVYSMPPDHGAAIVRMVLTDPHLKSEWITELNDMRNRMLKLRSGFAEALRRESNSSRFDFIADQRGMFSRLGIAPEEIDRIRADHGIYIVGDSRINIAGLPDNRLDEVARAIVSSIE